MIERHVNVAISLLIIWTLTASASSPPEKLLPPPATVYRRSPSTTIVRKANPEPPGFMTRIARWFGINDSPNEQQLQASYYQPQYKEAPFPNYRYVRPKAPCNPCNKDPWIPMFPGNLQYPLLKTDYPPQPQIKFTHNPNINSFDAPSQHISLPTYRPPPPPFSHMKQYAPAYNFPPPKSSFKRFPVIGVRTPHNYFKYPRPPAAIPLPNLSRSPIPPLYDSIPFRDFSGSNQLFETFSAVTQFPIQHEVHPSQIPPSLPASSQDASIEIVKSIPLTEFVSSVEYPPKVVQSPIVDITPNPQYLPSPTPSPLLPSSTPSSLLPSQPTQQSYYISSTPNYQENYASYPPPQVTEASYVPQPTVTTHISQQTFQPVDNYVTQNSLSDFENHLRHEIPRLTELGSYTPNHAINHQPAFTSPPVAQTEPDSHVAASSHNISYRNENNLDIGNFINNIPGEYTTTLNPLDIFSGAEFTTTEPPTTIPSIVPFEPYGEQRNRETPKHLLDSPIYYITGSSPRPFTRDPSDIQFRNAGRDHPNSLWQSSFSSTPWAFVPTPSTIHALPNASGLYFGVTPPSLFQSTPHPFEYASKPSAKNPKQIVIPYTINNKPTPFKVRVELSDKPGDDNNNSQYFQWATSHAADPHEQQESKVVTATQSPGADTKTTRYLTKILASNIRELLRREHDHRNKSRNTFDIVKLQKNIDDWTEQEFTSHMNKGSTVSLRGRSKNIPNEYLTTTPSLTKQRAISLFTSTSTTPRVGALLHNDELQKYEVLTKLVEDNRIETVDSASQQQPTTTENPHISPFYVRTTQPTSAPQELWNHLKVSISPLTKEKVYVVTPQTSQTQNLQTDVPGDSTGTFKSPRFLVRPTPGVGHSHKSNSTKPITPELFGLMGVSSYSPPAPVETLDGHSKVITIVTPLSFNKKRAAETEHASNKTTTQSQTSSPSSTTNQQATS